MENTITNPFDELLRTDNHNRWFKTSWVNHFNRPDPAAAETNRDMLVSAVAEALEYMRTDGFKKLQNSDNGLSAGSWADVIPWTPVRGDQYRTVIAQISSEAGDNSLVGSRFWIELRAEVEKLDYTGIGWGEGYLFEFSLDCPASVASNIQYDPTLPWLPDGEHHVDDYYDHSDETYLAAVQALFVCVEALKA